MSPNNFTSVAVDPTIHAAVPVANAFLVAFGIRPRTANKLGWIEATSQNGADYVAELAANTNKSDVIAPMVILEAKDADGQLIAPAYWSDNFFAMLPGQSKTVSCKTETTDVHFEISK